MAQYFGMLGNMAVKKIHIGTSGWSYKHWKGIYYPEGLKPTEWLPFYARQFHTTEINTSFYHLPKDETVHNWVAEVPRGFRFCPKMSRYITHMKKLLEPEEPLRRFFDVFDQIKKVLGPVLIQLPPFLKFEPQRTEHFFSVLKKQYRGYHFVLEVRNKTWLEQEALDLMKKYKIGFVIAQSGTGFPYSEAVTAKHIYIRFHGPGKLYASSYSDEQLRQFARKIRKWVKEGHTVWAYFNNDQHGYAIDNALSLKKMLKV